jgi:hypothetical protein
MVARASLGATVRRAAAGTLVAAAAGVLVGAVALTGRGAASGAPALALDATGPLFSATQLTPGATTTRCVTLSWTQAATDSAALYLYASASGGLAPYLTVTVESGTGGSYAGCAGFAGALLFNGGLDQFAAIYGDPTTAMALADTGAGDGSRTFRFTTTVVDDNAAQGATAGAAFTWGAEPDSPAGGTSSSPVTVPVTPTGSGTPTPSAGASGTPMTTPSRTPTATSTPTVDSTPGGGTDSQPPNDGAVGGVGPTAGPSTSDASESTAVASTDTGTTSGATAPASTRGGTPAGSRSPAAVPTVDSAPPAASPSERSGGLLVRAAASAWHAVNKATQVIVHDAPAAIRGGAFGLGSFPFLLLFLLLQRHIDRRDPKLALAPSHADAYLDFDPPTEDGR